MMRFIRRTEPLVRKIHSESVPTMEKRIALLEKDMKEYRLRFGILQNVTGLIVGAGVGIYMALMK